jgi:hypothetical protein
MTDSQDRPAATVARVTPYELVFGAPAFDETRFELLREQAETYGATRASELLLLPAAGELLHELIPVAEPDAAGAAGARTPDAKPEGAEQTDTRAAGAYREIVEQTGALLFHAFRFWLHGLAVYDFTGALLRPVLEPGHVVGEWRFRTPAPAGYVQLPHHLLWARVAEGAAPEPVDGFFWSAPAAEENAVQQRLDLLLVLGVRRGRPGVSLVDVTVEGTPELQHWADADARPGGGDFDNVLPGGELQGYHALTTPAEALKLASLCFWLIDRGTVTTDVPDPDAPQAVRHHQVHG